MKNVFGSSLTITLFGESHGAAIGATLDGLAPGLPVDESYIKTRLSLRRPSSSVDTKRREKDEFSIVSGVFNGVTTGAPLTIVIPNTDTRSADYQKTRAAARPSHADYTAHVKYDGCEDYRGGGHFSGRITAAIVAVTAPLLQALERLGIEIGSHVLTCADVCDTPFSLNPLSEIRRLKGERFPTLDAAKRDEMIAAIEKAASECDSVGGTIETAVCGLPCGLGEPWFDSTESMLSHALFSLGGVKGVQFGSGFAFASMRGSTANDEFYADEKGVHTYTNNNGGINGGITNGMPLVFSCAVKPTPSISREQKSIDLFTHENVPLRISGRHDPAIVRRICPVIDGITAFVIADLLTIGYGVNALKKGF